ncbi:MAG: type II secretion system protein [Planctomycetes bacterium]|nr:type II secretion system protein [Planctomycetota bacterium]
MKYKGLTLVELVTVIAVTAILIAVLFPALQSSKNYARSVMCSQNIRQIMLGLFAYESQNSALPFGFDSTLEYPPPQGYAGSGIIDESGWWWFNLLQSYFDKAGGRGQVPCCPSKKVTDLRLENNILCGNYGLNQSICKDSKKRKSRAEFTGKSLNSSDISRPSETLLVADSGYGLINWWHVTEKPPGRLDNTIRDMSYIPGMTINIDKKLWPGTEEDAIKGRHPGKKVNIGFADGHTARMKADDLLVEKTDTGYKNLSPLWSPAK